jgi:hypothetical protein
LADPPTGPDAGDETGVVADGGSTTGTPRWVKVFGIIALVVFVLFVVVVLVGGGEHGPGRHTPRAGSNTTSDAPWGHTGLPPGFEHGAQQP